MRISYFNYRESAIYRNFYIDSHNILWYIKIIQLFVHHLQVYDLQRTRCKVCTEERHAPV